MSAHTAPRRATAPIPATGRGSRATASRSGQRKGNASADRSKAAAAKAAAEHDIARDNSRSTAARGDDRQSDLRDADRKSVQPLAVRQRIREATQAAHQIIVERVRWSKRPYDTATWAGFAAEVQALARARRDAASGKAKPEDVRQVLLSVAASAVLLAEQVNRPAWISDRPDGPTRGTKRARTKRWTPLDFSVPA